MDSPASVAAVFAPGGAVARAREPYEFRSGQQRMAEAVARAFAERRRLVVEAATGVGKTLAYLVPALLADVPVVISTGTNALQEQIVSRELPLAVAATGADRTVAVLKGRENCVVVSNRPYVSRYWTTPGDYAVVLRAYNESHPEGVCSTGIVRVAAAPVLLTLRPTVPARHLLICLGRLRLQTFRMLWISRGQGRR